ncbi:hypothetical protein IAR55_001951 [Kwoniella newhampshirensis]|uniref:Rab-GAP TBC domain-containing protein n=1 Tax=Kwoniella newhampshirensis TaxID=1651941 RepID=A0AAW0Z3G6_9TREE
MVRYLDPRELNDLIALAGRGGIGRGIALTDCVAEAPDQLMYIKDDELILLRDLGQVLLASCEGIIGWVERDHVKFDSLASASTPPSATSSPSKLPRTILTAPSPPPHHNVNDLVSEGRGEDDGEEDGEWLEEPLISRRDVKRVSGPFELDSPVQSPSLGREEEQFFPSRSQPGQQPGRGSGPECAQSETARESMVSQTSSEGFGGIGGFMMGGRDSGRWEESKEPEDGVEVLKEDQSPTTPHINTPLRDSSTTASSPSPSSPTAQHSELATSNPEPEYVEDDEDDGSDDFAEDDDDDEDGDWDIYGDYARESMYGPAKRMSLAVQQRRLSRAAKTASRLGPVGGGKMARTSEDSNDATGSARSATQGSNVKISEFRLPSAGRQSSESSDRSKTTSGEGEMLDMQEEDQTTPRIPHPSSPTPTPPIHLKTEAPQESRSVATELRLRIMREREQGSAILSKAVSPPATPTSPVRINDPPGTVESGRTTDTSPDHVQSSEESTEIATPHAPDIVTFTGPSPPTFSKQSASVDMSKGSSGQSLLASPLSIDDSNTESTSVGRSASTSLIPPPPPLHSPNLSPNVHHSPWSPGSPASPHSVDATRQAVEVSKSNGEGQRPRGLTLVGRMDADLRASKGPVPITFLVNGPGIPPPLSSAPTGPSSHHIGLGLPQFAGGRASPGAHEVRRATSPLASPATFETRRATSPLASPILANDPTASDQSSRFPAHPQPKRSVTSPVPPVLSPIAQEARPGPAPIGRPRSRSFSSTVTNKLMVGRKNNIPLSIDTEAPPLPLPTLASPIAQSASSSKKGFFGSRKSALAPQTPPLTSPSTSTRGSSTRASASGSSVTMHQVTGASPSTLLSNDPTPSLRPPSGRSSSFTFPGKGSKTPRKASRALASPISHKDFAEETVKADGMDFELVQPRKIGSGLLSPSEASLDVHSSPSSVGSGSFDRPELSGLKRDVTMQSFGSNGSLRPLPDTDEWGFLKDKSPTPEIFQSRSAPGDHRVIEGKWLAIISTSLNGAAPPKKVRKLVLDAGVPASLRGRVWAWFMAGTLSARVPGLYQELLEHDNGQEDERIDRDVEAAYPDHSIFCEPNSPGQQDLRSILRAYSDFAPAGYRSEMALIAGALLIHCVAEDAFWLLSGLVNVVLKDYYAKEKVGMRIDAAVFVGLLQGQEPKLAALLKNVGIHPIAFLDKWFSQLFIRCLPWPTALRVVDAVVSEGPRFLLLASLAILTVSRDRLLRLPRSQSAILAYLHDLPQDSLLLPENLMKVCEGIKFDEKDWRKLRDRVEMEVMGV